MPPDLRPARPEDFRAVSTLLSEAELPIADLGATLAGFVVAEAQGQIVGVAGIELHLGHALLRSVAVRADVRGTRLGERLVHDRLAWASSRGAVDVYLLTTTAPLFFERFGFEPVERHSAPAPLQRTSEFASLCPESAVVMRRAFEDTPQAR